MKDRPVVDIEYLLPLVHQDAFSQPKPTAVLEHGLQVVYLNMMVGQVLLVRDGVD